MTDTPTIAFSVPDMTCGHCAATIRTALEKALPGAAIEIDVPTARVSVTGDGQTAETAIRNAGYSPRRA